MPSAAPVGVGAIVLVFVVCTVHAQDLLQTDYTSGGRPQRVEYSRCKTTHRCNLAIVEWDGHLGTMEFTKLGVRTASGDPLSRSKNAELWQNFEQWRLGSMGFQVDQALLNGTLNATIGAHFNSFNIERFPVQGPIEEGEAFTEFELAFNMSMELTFNTTDCISFLYADVLDRDEPGFVWPDEREPWLNFTGTITNDTTDGSYVCVWNFLSVYLGSQMRVNITGDKPMVLMSRSTMILDTELVVEPGTLGGMPGVETWSPFQNNQHGLGSPAVRAYWATVRTFGDDVNEVQTVTTQGDQGHTLGGGFRLLYQGVTTSPIPHDAGPAEARRIMETHWPLAGRLDVTRTARDNEGGHAWTITFLTAVGDRPQIEVVDELTGVGHRAFTATLQDGNDISGWFRLGFLGGVTRGIPVTASAEDVRLVLEEDLVDFGLLNAEVVRSNPNDEACQAGLCPNGPQEAWGLTWSFTLVTDVGIVEPTSPLDDHPTLQEFIEPEPPTLHSFNVTSSVPGANASMEFFHGFDNSEAVGVVPHNVSTPITLPYGGFGASYGGVGGVGHARHRAKPTYNDEVLTWLIGGSGGAMGGETVHQIMGAATHSPVMDQYTAVGPARGGDGGGVLHFISVNDIIVGRHGGIFAEGEAGGDGFRAAGGGSGGAVLISAGGVLVVHSTVSVKGGDGGRGIGVGSRGGGGGAGGRLAGFAQSFSVVDQGYMEVAGGRGGKDEELVNATRVAELQEAGAVVTPSNTLFSGFERPDDEIDGGTGKLWIVSGAGAQYRIELNEGGAEGTARALRVAANDTILNENGVVVRAPYANNGPSFTFPAGGTWFVRRGVRAPELGEGGVAAHGGKNPGVTPRRVTVYVKVGAPPHGALSSHWGAHIALHEFDYRPISNDTGIQNKPLEGNLPGATGANGAGGPGSAGGGGVPGDSGEGGGVGNDAAALVGVALVDGKFKHDANYRHTPGIDLPVDSPQTVAYRHVEADRWYKIDIFFSWQNHTYKVRVDDYTVVLDAPFVGDKVSRLGLYTFHQSVAWFDEVYVGPEDTMNFECPQTLADKHLRMQRPIQTGWDEPELGPTTQTWPETRHSSHISKREAFVKVPADMGIVEGDGPPHLMFHSDIITRTMDGDHNDTFGEVMAAAMTWVPAARHVDNPVGFEWQRDAPPRDMLHRAYTLDNSGSDWGSGEREGMGGDNHGETGRFYWYGEHDVNTDLPGFGDYNLDRSEEVIQGGIVACSTNDMLSWRNEGTMMHFRDMFNSLADPLNPAETQIELRAERPRVMWNEKNQEYVIWMVGDTFDQSLRQIGIATSQLPNGPFAFDSTILPDGNVTVDFTVFRDPDGTVFLARTFYANKTYFLPAPIMQPVWESSKAADSTDFDPVVDYGLNFHRAFYHHLYDNVEDTYLQRWRLEHLEWRIETGDWVETYDGTQELFQLTHRVTGEEHVASPYERGRRQAVLAAVYDEHTFRDIQGQGRPPILSRYKDPLNPDVTSWSPGSVPAVKAQSWSENYMDKNIADNALHSTVADLLIGPTRIVEVRRTKYLSISLVDDDYKDTVGVLTQIEGELENEDDLIVLMQQFGRFGFTGQGKPDVDDTEFIATFPFDEDGQLPPFEFTTKPDWLWRHWQFNNTKQDRFDFTGTAPHDVTITHHDTVNFRDKQVSTRCPHLHFLAETKYNECEDLRMAQRLELLTPQINFYQELQSYAEAMSTALYEACLVEHEAALKEYEDCVRVQLVDFNELEPWGVGFRDCVGGAGPCTREPEPGYENPNP